MGKIASWAVGLLGSAVDKTPGVGNLHRWTRDTASTSKAALNILRLIVYTCVACMIFTVGMAFKIILAGKMDAVAGTVVGGIFTLLGTILAVTLPAFVTVLNNVAAATATAAPANDTPADPPVTQ